MSNFLAIATVTAGLQRVLEAAVSVDVPGATVTTERPETRQGNAGTAGVNVFLYETIPNGAHRNADVPTRDGGGQVLVRPTAALDLHYLLSFYGSEKDLEPQRLSAASVESFSR